MGTDGAMLPHDDPPPRPRTLAGIGAVAERGVRDAEG